ncbi:hypothetical protein [Macrococcus sp. S115]|uniref:hypothetical protein n=1 Tax=Macrococcus sp. S115 TaxID=3047480 RepID=UPI0024BCBC91|nr:hypothetical protein [Macrococcus sp. S115]MDJ1111450.1 hypothetical protein [Macrococcus sp. S115]
MISTQRIYKIKKEDFYGVFQKAYFNPATTVEKHPVAVIKYDDRLIECYPAQVEFEEE